MKFNSVESAVQYLSQPVGSGARLCWCGRSAGHCGPDSRCPKCGQPFDTVASTMSRWQLLQRWIRRPVHVSRAGHHARDMRLIMFGEWRYWTAPDWKPETFALYRFEDFEAACAQKESENIC